MPVYEYRCAHCGPFDQHRASDNASQPAACPSCSGAAKRVYTAPGLRSTSGVIAGASTSDRARVDRARSGEPSLTGPPTGRRPRSGPHAH